jgi:hypothetical protein
MQDPTPMLKNVARLATLCLLAALWIGQTADVRPGDRGLRHVAGLAGHSAVLGTSTSTRIREQGNAGPHGSNGAPGRPLPPLASDLPLVSMTRSIVSFPSYLLSITLRL